MAENKASDVREAQRFLRTISKYNSNIPTVNADGTYGEETRNAVSAFQRESGLPETGELDPKTWDELYKLYKEAAMFFSELESISPRAVGETPLTIGSAGYPVYIIQIMLNTIAQFYDNLSGAAINGIYDNETAEEVRRIQAIAGLPETGMLNRATWNALARIYNYHAAIDDIEDDKAVYTMNVGAVG
ncbi:MAG: peptidoglycan-binding protein [Oscillospiraceae bacterium]